MNTIKTILGVALIATPFLLVSQPARHIQATEVWVRTDIECSGYPGCEKTNCTTGLVEQCTAQYCNAQYCGGSGEPGGGGEPIDQNP